MDTIMKQLMAESVKKFKMPRYNDLPCGLYLEQISSYINEKLAPLGCLEITPSMVSNYVKKGLIPNPVKKRYDAEHAAYLFFIMFAKNILSIDDISMLIDIQRNSYALQVAYDYMCEEMESMLYYVFDITDTLEVHGETESQEKDLFYNFMFSSVYTIYLRAWFAQIRSAGNTTEKTVQA